MLELVVGYDNKIRTVKVKQSNGSIEYHSLINLYPMEINYNPGSKTNETTDDIEIGENGKDSEEQVIAPEVRTRPKRKATERFHKLMRDEIENL